MNIEQAIIKKVKVLPSEKQQEILDFAEFIQQKVTPLPGSKTHQQRANNWKKWAAMKKIARYYQMKPQYKNYL